MKLVGMISTAVLSLTLGITAPVYAQQEQHDQQDEQKAKPAQQNEKKTQPAKQQEKSAQRRQDQHPSRLRELTQQQDKNAKQQQ